MTVDSRAATGTIEDRGYRRYTGVRLGVWFAVWTMMLAALRRAMGIRRSFRSKIMPWLLLAAPYAPVVFILAARQVESHVDSSILPSLTLYSGLYTFISLPVILFSALVAPDLLCPERRERVLSLYFVAPISRAHYVLAKLGAMLLLLLAMTVVPALLLFLGGVFLAHDPISFLRDNVQDLGAIVLGGLLLSTYFAATSLLVAAFNERRHYAAGVYVGVLLVSTAASHILVHEIRAHGREGFGLLGLLGLPINAMLWIAGQPLSPDLNGWSYLAVSVGVIAVSLALVGWKYVWLRE